MLPIFITYIQGIKKHFPEDAITNIRKMREKICNDEVKSVLEQIYYKKYEEDKYGYYATRQNKKIE